MANSLESTGTTAASTALVPVFAGRLQGQSVQLCDARTLHAFMGVLRDFTDWVKARIRKFDFVEGVDFLKIIGSPEKGNQTRGGNRKETTDYHLTLDMAKELSMVENNDKGKEARRYFMACEKQVIEQLQAPVEPRIAYTVGPNDTLSAMQAEQLRLIFSNRCGQLPKDSQAAFMTKGWSKMKSHFGCTYRQIPQREFSEAVSLATRHAAQWVVLDAALPAPAPTVGVQRWLTTVNAQGIPTVEAVPVDVFICTVAALPELTIQNIRLLTDAQVQAIAMQANMRMMGIMGLGQENTEFVALKTTVRNLGGHDLYEIMKQGHMEISLRNTGSPDDKNLLTGKRPSAH